MPFIPHTEDDVRDMLAVIGVEHVDDLFDEIPESLRIRDGLARVPAGLGEQQVAHLMSGRAARDGRPLCFLGAGAYEHHIPAVVWELTTRGEFYSAYTPYQAEASQGTLQLLYEFQTMMTRLMAMEVSNTSLYDGASAFAEAILMAVRSHRKSKSKRVLVPKNLHPAYRSTARTIVSNQRIELIEIDYDPASGRTAMERLEDFRGEDITALVIPQPNFFGVLEDVHGLCNWAHENQALAIGVVNPLAMALLAPPGEWGEKGVDIACGEGQPLGVPLSSGGPYFGFMCCRKSLVRQMPGRIVGRTRDTNDRPGYTLTLQAREQHIRRSKATSNICTNQGLLVTAATIHMALLGGEGLRRVALACHAQTRRLVDRLRMIQGVAPRFSGPFFHEAVLQLDLSIDGVMASLHAQNILPGYSLGREYPELENGLLVCATEMRSDEDIERFAGQLEQEMSARATG